MKVILTAEVKGKGHEGDVVDVARGYAANFLMPRKMAIAATVGNLKQRDARMGNILKRNDARRSEAEQLAGSINGKTIRIEANAGDEGKLFGSVTTLMIEEAVLAQLGADIDHRRMDLHKAIKMLGEYPVKVSVFGEVHANFVVKVIREGAAPEAVVVETIAEPVEAEAADEAVAETVDTETADEAVEDEAAEATEE